MIGVADGLNGLKIGSSILTRRGGTDANTPESIWKVFCEIGMLAIWVPKFVEDCWTDHRSSRNFLISKVEETCVWVTHWHGVRRRRRRESWKLTKRNFKQQRKHKNLLLHHKISINLVLPMALTKTQCQIKWVQNLLWLRIKYKTYSQRLSQSLQILT